MGAYGCICFVFAHMNFFFFPQEDSFALVDLHVAPSDGFCDFICLFFV